MNFAAEDVKRLREVTGAGFADCKSALTEASSFEAAVKLIEQKGQTRAEKVKGQDRETLQGAIVSYLHGGRIGALVEVNCSTDFVARSEDFQRLAHDLAVQIAGFDPKYISFNDVPPEILDEARKEIEKDPEVAKKSANVRAKIIDGKLKKQFGPSILLEQIWVKDETKTIAALIDDVIRKTGENIIVRRFARFVLGEEHTPDTLVARRVPLDS